MTNRKKSRAPDVIGRGRLHAAPTSYEARQDALREWARAHGFLPVPRGAPSRNLRDRSDQPRR